MLDYNDLLNAIKKAAVDAVNASKPTSIVFGSVTSVAPLKISIDQKLNLTAAQLILTRQVTEHYTDITIDGMQKRITVHSELVTGDQVIMVQVQGGQKYIVLDVMKT